MIVKVKICGITSVADALAAVDAGADALGFMFYAPSPRNVSFGLAADIIRQLPPFVAKAGVFVNPAEDDVRRAIAECGLDTLQFHGEETPEFCRRFGLKTMKAFRVRDAEFLKQTGPYTDEAWLLDSYVAAPGLVPALRFWVVNQKVASRLIEEGEQAAKTLLARVQARTPR